MYSKRSIIFTHSSSINHLLKQTELKLAVLENEVGEVAVDDDLLDTANRQRTDGPEVILMPSGCVCCKVRGDLVECLKRMIHQPGLDGLVLELSGLADVAPVAQTFFASPDLQEHLQLDAVVCVANSQRLCKLLLQKDGPAEEVVSRVGREAGGADTDPPRAAGPALLRAAPPAAHAPRTTASSPAGVGGWLSTVANDSPVRLPPLAARCAPATRCLHRPW